MQMLGVIPEIALESTRLPDALKDSDPLRAKARVESYAPHGDPIDRLLMASARVHNLTLVTADEKILAYADQGHLKALKA